MKIFDLFDEAGRLRAFEIENSAISREGVVRVLKTIPGLVVTHTRTWYGRGEDFCDFEVAGTSFQAREPLDMRPRYWIGPSSPIYSPHIALARSAFAEHREPRWISPLRVISVSAMGFSAMWLVVLPAVAESSTERNALLVLAGVGFFAGAAVLSRTVVLMRGGKAG